MKERLYLVKINIRNNGKKQSENTAKNKSTEIKDEGTETKCGVWRESANSLFSKVLAKQTHKTSVNLLNNWASKY